MQSIFINLVVKDLEKSKAFAEALGWRINPQFTDETGAAVVIGKHIFAMFLTEQTMKRFTSKEIVNAKQSTEIILSLSVDIKSEVDELIQKALAAGATEPRPPEVFDFMYNRAFEDLDGHIWEIFWMDPKYIKAS